MVSASHPSRDLRRRTVALAGALALACAAVGCGAALTAAAGLGFGLQEDDDATDARPLAAVETPAGILCDVVALDYRLVDAEGDRVSVLVEWSLDGASFAPATQSLGEGAEGTVNLTASPQGEAHTFLWNASADLGFVDAQGARLRLTPRDAAHSSRVGEAAVSGTFDVFNTFITTLASNPPSLGVVGTGLAEAADGDIVVADALGHRVLRLDVATGETSILAGTGERGFNGSSKPGAEVQLDFPLSVAVVPGAGASDDVLVADAGNGRVRRIDGRTGFVVDVAGGGDQRVGEEILARDALLSGGDIAAFASGDLLLLDEERRARAVNLASTSLDFPTGTLGGAACGVGPTLSILPERIGTVIGRDVLCTGTSALVERLREAGAVAVYDDGGGVRTVYVLEASPPEGNTVTLGEYPRLTASNFGAAPIDLQPLSGAPVQVEPGDIAVVASGADLPDIALLPDLAVVAPDVLAVTVTEGNAVFAVNVSLAAASVVGTDVASGSIERVIGTGTASLGGTPTGPLETALVAPVSAHVTPEGHVVVGELTGRLRVAASPNQPFAFGDQVVPPGVVDTLAVALPGVVAGIVRPFGVALAPGGDLFVTDVEVLDPRSNRLLRVRAADGVVEPVLGNGVFGSSGDGGPALEAAVGTLGRPALAADGALVLVPDVAHHRVRAVNPTESPRTLLGVTVAPGEVETVVGSGEPTDDPTDSAAVGDGLPAGQARLTSPTVVATGPEGLLWISDSGANRVRVCNPSGVSVTVLGVPIAPGAIATVVGRSGVAGDVADDGQTDPAQATLRFPAAFFGADGLLYVCDGLEEPRQPRVRALNLGATAATLGGVVVAPGQLVRVIGSGEARAADDANLGDGGPALAATFRSISGIAVRADRVAFVADERDHRIRAVNLGQEPVDLGGLVVAPGAIETLVGTGAPGFDGDPGLIGSARIDAPFTLHAFPDGRLLFADSGNGALRLVNLAATGRTFGGAFAAPGEVVVAAGSRSGRARPGRPLDLRVDAAGQVVFSDAGALGDSPRLLVLDPTTRLVGRLAGTGEATASDGSDLGDGGPAWAATLRDPRGVALDDAGVYVADLGNQRVRYVNRGAGAATPLAGVTVPPGAIETLIHGGAGDGQFANDEGLPVRPGSPPGETIDAVSPLALARAGDVLWVLDARQLRVLRVDAATGTLASQFLGSPEVIGTSDPLAAARVLVDSAAPFAGVVPGDVVVIRGSSALPVTVNGQPVRLPATVRVLIKINASALLVDQPLGPLGASFDYEVMTPSTPLALAAVDEVGAYVAFDGDGGAVVEELEYDPIGGGWSKTLVAGAEASGWNGDRLPATSMNIDSVAGMERQGDLLLLSDPVQHRLLAIHTGLSGTLTVGGLEVEPGEARTVAGAGAGAGGFNGDALPPGLALLNQPTGVALGADGGVYLSDSANGRIRRFQR